MMDMTNFMMNMTPQTDFPAGAATFSVPQDFDDFAMDDFLNMESADFSNAVSTDMPAPDAPEIKVDHADNNLLSLLNLDQLEPNNP